MADYRQHDENYAYRGKHSAQRAPEVAPVSNPEPRRVAYTAPDPVFNPTPAAAMPTSNPMASAYDYDAFTQSVAQRRAERKRKNRRNRVLAVIGALVLVAVLGVGGYFIALNSAMSLGSNAASVNDVLTETSLDEPFYMLLVGSDWREDSGVTDDEAMSGDQQRADVMILARVDRKNSQVTLLTIPRDTPYRDADGSYMKLNEVYNQGRGAALIPAVENVTGVKISHYAEIYFSGLVNVVDALGGVEVDVPFDIEGTDMLTDEGIFIPEGTQTLNGREAALFARERHSYGEDQDANRQAAIRTIVEAIVNKARQASPVQFPSIVLSAANCLRTDLDAGEVIHLARGFYDDVTMYSGTGPYAGSVNSAAGDLWLCYEDPEGWGRVMNVVDSGGDPSEVSYSGDVAYVAGTGESVIVE